MFEGEKISMVHHHVWIHSTSSTGSIAFSMGFCVAATQLMHTTYIDRSAYPVQVVYTSPSSVPYIRFRTWTALLIPLCAPGPTHANALYLSARLLSPAELLHCTVRQHRHGQPLYLPDWQQLQSGLTHRMHTWNLEHEVELVRR